MATVTALYSSTNSVPPSNVVIDSAGRQWVVVSGAFTDEVRTYYSDDDGVTWVACPTAFRQDFRNTFYFPVKRLDLDPSGALILSLVWSGGAAGGPTLHRGVVNAARTDVTFSTLSAPSQKYYGWDQSKSTMRIYPLNSNGGALQDFMVATTTYDPGSTSGTVRSWFSFDYFTPQTSTTGTDKSYFQLSPGGAMWLTRKVDRTGAWVGTPTLFALQATGSAILVRPVAGTTPAASGTTYTVVPNGVPLATGATGVRGAYDAAGDRLVIAVGLGVWVVPAASAMTSSTVATALNPPALSGALGFPDVAVDSRGRIRLASAAAGGWYETVYDAGAWSAWTLLAAATISGANGAPQVYLSDVVTAASRDLPLSGHIVNSSGNTTAYVLRNLTGTAPTPAAQLTPASGSSVDRALTIRLGWNFADLDPGDVQGGYELRYRVAGTTAWTTVAGATAATYRDFAAGTFSVNTWEWQVRIQDAALTFSDWSAVVTFVAAVAPPAPAIASPAQGATVPGPDQTVTWTATSQESYRVRRVADDGTGSPAPGTVYGDGGPVIDAAARTAAVAFPVTGRTEHLQVQVGVKNVWSPWASVRVAVAYTPPGACALSATVAQTGTPRMVVVATWARGAVSGRAFLALERSLDGAATWTALSTVDAGTAGDATSSYQDTDLPSGQVTSYRVRAYVVAGDAQRVDGPYSPAASALFTVYADYFVNLVTSRSAVARLQSSDRKARPWEGSVVYPLEGDTAIILSGRQYKPEGAAVAAFRTWPAAMALEEMLLGIYPLLWRRPLDSSGWQRPDMRIRVKPGSVRLRPAEATDVRWAACLVEFEWVAQ